MSANNLVIVESPAKAKTIAKYLGKDFDVLSSFGHIRDLPKKGMSVDIENNFKPSYEVSSDKKKTVSQLKSAAKNAKTIWLASDEDREGEAIAWHLSEALKLDPKNTKRIVFHEITKPAIEAAIEKPRQIDINLVNAQQARRILDRIVGYELSPVLWRKVKPSLSAGRVQSVAVRLIVEREREIDDFVPEVTFKVAAILSKKDGTQFSSEATHKFLGEDEAKKFLENLRTSNLCVAYITKSPVSRSPSAPFTTSTLQQEASRKLGYSPKQTMMLAQRLYENGHITYMRTDSLNISDLAIKAIADLVKYEFGEKYLEVRKYKTKSAGAQEAHEAIRPTNFTHKSAGDDVQQQKLYELIWKRAVASQMSKAQLEKTVVGIATTQNPDVILEAKGETVDFDGFLKLFPRSKKVDANEAQNNDILPSFEKGEDLSLINAAGEQTYSRAPARYTEASLIRKLEENGIGRPSTYAPTISTIQTRGYVEKADVIGGERSVVRLNLENDEITRTESMEPIPDDKGKLVPTDIGKVVTDFLVEHFEHVIDYDFTANVEEKFDQVAEGQLAWQKMLEEFYRPFHKTVEDSEDITRAEAMQSRELGTDPKSGRPVSARFGRFGPMVQIGTKDDEEKPKFASIPTGIGLEDITLEQALELFKLPRHLGKTEGGEDIESNIGRFGPYIKIGAKRFISIKDYDPYTVKLEDVADIIKADDEKRAKMTIHDFGESGIRVLNGRFGPYITDGKKNVKIPKDVEPASLTEATCKAMLEKAPVKSARKRVKRS